MTTPNDVLMFFCQVVNKTLEKEILLTSFQSLSLFEKMEMIEKLAHSEHVGMQIPSLTALIRQDLDVATPPERQQVFEQVCNLIGKFSFFLEEGVLISLSHDLGFAQDIKDRATLGKGYSKNEFGRTLNALITSSIYSGQLDFNQKMLWATAPNPVIHIERGDFSKATIEQYIDLINQHVVRPDGSYDEHIIKEVLRQGNKKDIAEMLTVVDPTMNNGRLLYWVLSETEVNHDAVTALRPHIDPVAMIKPRFFNVSTSERYHVLGHLCDHFPEYAKQWVGLYKSDQYRFEGSKNKRDKLQLQEIEEQVAKTSLPIHVQNQILHAHLASPAPSPPSKKKM